MATHALPRSQSTERRTTLVVLVVATVVALACAVGPVWLVRAGVLVALVGAALSVWCAYREIARLEAVHRTELKALRDRATEESRAHHEESMDLIATFAARTKAHAAQLSELRGELAERQQQLSSLRGNIVSLTAEGERRSGRIAELEAELGERTDELTALEQQLAAMAESGELDESLVTLPRRVVAARVAERGVPTAAELWSDGNHPTVVDLALLNLPAFDERKQA